MSPSHSPKMASEPPGRIVCSRTPGRLQISLQRDGLPLYHLAGFTSKWIPTVWMNPRSQEKGIFRFEDTEAFTETGTANLRRASSCQERPSVIRWKCQDKAAIFSGSAARSQER